MVVDGEVLEFRGDIDVGDEERFAEVLSESPDVALLQLESRGGDVYTAMEISRLVQRRRLDVEVVGDCLSACSLVLIGGAGRSVADGAVGFHRVLNVETGRPVAVEDALYNRLTMFAWMSGVDPLRFVQWMMLAEPDQIYFPEDEELCRARVITDCD